MRLRMPVKKMLGVSSGRVMWRKRARRPAPSTCAASWYSCGMAWRPARKMMTLTPRPCQTLMRMMDGIAHMGSRRSSAGAGCRATPSSSLSRPALGRIDPEPHQADRDGRGHERQEVHRPDPRDAPDGLVEAQRDGQRHGHAQGHRDDRVEDGVAERHPEAVVVEQVAEVVQADRTSAASAGPTTSG